MQILKYFHEEPAALELLAPDEETDARQPAELRSLEDFLSGPRYYRGYLAGTDMKSGRTGASVLGGELVCAVLCAATGVPLKEAPPHGTYAVGTSGAESISLPGDDRQARIQIREWLDGGHSVLKSEPAPDGHDWSVYAARPMADAVRSALEQQSGLRRFVIPYRVARGEHRFYFERYDLEMYAQFEV